MSPLRTGTRAVGARVLVNRWSRRASTLTLPLVVVAAAAACGASSPATSASPPSSAATSRAPSSAPPTAPATATPTTTAAPPDDETQVRAVIDKYWEEWTAVGNPPDLNRSSFFSLLTGSALSNETEALKTKAALGQSRRLPSPAVFSHRIQRVTVSADAAVVVECVVDDAVVFNVADGEVLNDRVATYQFDTRLVRLGPDWKIAESSTRWDGKGVAECPDA